jgi:hypothetical protein
VFDSPKLSSLAEIIEWGMVNSAEPAVSPGDYERGSL